MQGEKYECTRRLEINVLWLAEVINLNTLTVDLQTSTSLFLEVNRVE